MSATFRDAIEPGRMRRFPGERAEAERIEAALLFIDPTDRETWYRVGTAIKSELGEAGFDIWDTWSQQSEKYDPKDAKSVWKSLKHGKVNVGTVFFEARQNGWRDNGTYQRPSPGELAESNRRIKEVRAAAEAEEALRHAEAATKAAMLWAEAAPCQRHDYLSRKGIEPHGTRVHGDKLLVPMRDAEGVLRSLQIVGSDGSKRFLSGGLVKGCYYSIGGRPDEALCVSEGFGTAASIHEATGLPVAVAFNAGNMLAVAEAMRDKFPGLRLVLCGDVDRSGAGQRAAREAAQAVDGVVALPPFSAEELSGNKPPSDWNDYAVLHGLEATKAAINSAIDSAVMAKAKENATGATLERQNWPEPQPLTAKIEPEPYPLDALPGTVRAAVEEVQDFTKAPIPLVAASALATLSLACQAHIDAKRAERLQGPVGLFLLTIADSGERKSTCDSFFASAIRQYQEERAEAMKPAIKEYQAEIAAWEAERDGILSAIKGAAKSGKSTENLRADLADLQRDKPKPPRVPRLLYADATPEALAYNLAQQWPSGGVVSAEGGIVFGSHGMSKDSVMRNLATLNQLWDGTSLTIDRRTSESFTVKGARLTVALQVQEPTLREFFAKSGELARGTGFLARFLVAWPESTQGQRFFTEVPTNWPHLAAFHRRIAEILSQPAPIDEDGALSPAMLTLTPEAKAAWVEFHDAIERELASGGELYDVRDVASKSADNAARLAALFQIFEHGMGGAIGLECFESASRIAAWHLSEARRFFGELVLPPELVDAARLDSWLIEYCQKERTHLVGKNHVRQHGPMRDGARLDAAIRELAELDRLQLVKDGKRLTIHLNPALVGVEP